MMNIQEFDISLLKNLYKPASDSHKGQNGRLLVIGGSKLFHASIFWSASIASRIVDLVHFTSPTMENNDLMRVKAKEKFWEGIVVPFEKIGEYIEEDDCILIGPGMPREEGLMEGETPTKEIINLLLKKYPDKKWVVDGGALQEVDPALLNDKMIITPHQREWERLAGDGQVDIFSKQHDNLTVLLKGQKDVVCKGDEVIEIIGGNEGLTKGGTGDILAGLVAALYCNNDSILAATAGSFILKKSSDELYEKVGRFYNAEDLLKNIPVTMKKLV